MTVFPLPQFDHTGGRIGVTSPYGPRPSLGGDHKGTDLGSSDGIEQGVDVAANEAGEIIRWSRDPFKSGAGLNLWLLTDRIVIDGRGRRCRVGYKNFHLLDIIVKSGRVAEGQHIAEVGASGTSAAHLHQQCHWVPIIAGVDPVFWDWSDATAVSHTQELRDLIAAGRFPGTQPGATPTPEPPEEEIVTEDDKDDIAQRVAQILTNRPGEVAPFAENLAHIVRQNDATLVAITGMDDAQEVIDALGPNAQGNNRDSIAAVLAKLEAMDQHYNTRLDALEAKA